MKKPALRLMIGSEEFRAIGHVAAQWAYLETQIDLVTHVLCSQPIVQGLGFMKQQSFKKRMKNLREVARIVLEKHETELTQLTKIAEDASSLRGLRDQIVHGQWRLIRKNGKKGGLYTGIDIIKQYPSFESSTKTFSAEKAEEIANKISEVNLRLIIWSQQNIPH